MATLLADPARLIRRLGLPKDTQPTDDHLDALEAASDRFRLDVRHPVHEVTEDVYLDGRGGRTLNLPAAPVHAVELVELNGAERTVGIGAGHDVRWSRDAGILYLAAGLFPDEPQAVRVRYTHGYSTEWETTDPATQARLVPSPLQNEIVNLAQYVLQVVKEGALGVNTLTVGARSVSYSAAAYNAGVTESWTNAVAQYALNQGGSA